MFHIKLWYLVFQIDFKTLFYCISYQNWLNNVLELIFTTNIKITRVEASRKRNARPALGERPRGRAISPPRWRWPNLRCATTTGACPPTSGMAWPWPPSGKARLTTMTMGPRRVSMTSSEQEETCSWLRPPSRCATLGGRPPRVTKVLIWFFYFLYRIA